MTGIPPSAVRAAADLASTALAAVTPDRLAAPTPCRDLDVRALVDHLAWAAVPAELDTAADAWADRAAWEGETLMGTAPMPAAVVGPLMLAEFVLHGWDLARAVGAPYDVPAALGEATLAAVTPIAQRGRDGGWYGPEVPVPAGAPALDRALGLTGRDPAWTP
jgi:hypothetical protein